jgi:hypothetical protein
MEEGKRAWRGEKEENTESAEVSGFRLPGRLDPIHVFAGHSTRVMPVSDRREAARGRPAPIPEHRRLFSKLT